MEYNTGDKVTLMRVDKQSVHYVEGMEQFINHDGILDAVPGQLLPNVMFGTISIYVPCQWYEPATMISLSDVLKELEGGPWDNVRHRLEKRFRRIDPAVVEAITLLEAAGYTVTKHKS
jgi:hypothetical protein